MQGFTYGRDSEVVQRLRPEPMTPEEQAAQGKIDDVDFEIFTHKMNMIAQEGKETTMKLGASTGMRWGDVAFGIYTLKGDLAVVATGIWFHAVVVHGFARVSRAQAPDDSTRRRVKDNRAREGGGNPRERVGSPGEPDRRGWAGRLLTLPDSATLAQQPHGSQLKATGASGAKRLAGLINPGSHLGW